MKRALSTPRLLKTVFSVIELTNDIDFREGNARECSWWMHNATATNLGDDPRLIQGPGDQVGAGNGGIHNLNLGNGGSDEPDGDELPGGGWRDRIRERDDDRHEREFRPVNPRNITEHM